MRRDARAFLWDARDAAGQASRFVEGKSFHDYCEDGMLHSAVERKLEIIGEALNQLEKLDQDLACQVPELKRIVGLRNVLIHGYVAIEHDLIWRVIHENLPDLIAALDALLGPGRLSPE